ncbi:Protein ABIL2 [Hibiscus syriacus]|uniref:Protein ABIL2 n=1 Tax=Hibiscus syriacus TaxID=106335 RepID=A0A6A2XMQ8_HIBSY|nr:Protein ABIL2 [Hibiscus syriacus]
MSWTQESSHRDEFFMQQTLLFSDNLKDLKSLRNQLYSAAEYFEMAYTKQLQKQIVEETVKDYAIKALVNTVDHLGSVAYKINSFLDEKMIEYSAMERRLWCLEQRLRTCQDFVNLGGLSQQSIVLEAPKHHKHYIFPGKLFRLILVHSSLRKWLIVKKKTSEIPYDFNFFRKDTETTVLEETLNDVANTRLKSNSMFAIVDLNRFKNIGIEAKPADSSSECVGDGWFMLRSPRPVPRQRPQLLSSVSMNQKLVPVGALKNRFVVGIKLIKKKHGKDISKDNRALGKLRREAERAKRALNNQHRVRVEIESLFDGVVVDFSEPLTRACFEELNNDLFRKSGRPWDLCQKSNMIF